MNQEHNPQAEQMGDESMARNLAHQAEAIWPQERLLFDRYGLSGHFEIADIGCGTGEITRRLAAQYPEARVLGMDIMDSNLQLARRVDAGNGRIRYEQGDAFHLGYPDASFDLLICRHMSQAVPDFERVLAEFTRVLRPGGWLHLLSEDYGMLHMKVAELDPDKFWNEVVLAFLSSIGCDGRIGRHSPSLLASAGYRDIAMDYVVVDTLRVPRETFANILEAWRDGYSEALAASSGREPASIAASFNAIIESIRIAPNYAVWHVPVISARRP